MSIPPVRVEPSLQVRLEGKGVQTFITLPQLPPRLAAQHPGSISRRYAVRAGS